MATAGDTLVASTSRGCKALNAGGGVTTVFTQDAMTRGPVIEFPSITSAAQAKLWVDSPAGSSILRNAFDCTSRLARLQKLKGTMAGRTLYVRFATSTGDAMGMNMIALAAGHLIKAHIQHNGSVPTTPLPSRPTTPAPFATIDILREVVTTSDSLHAETPSKEERSQLSTT